MTGLLAPGSHRATGLVDDAALVAAMLRVETAWAWALVVAGLVDDDAAEAVERAAVTLRPDPGSLLADTELAEYNQIYLPYLRGFQYRQFSSLC